MRAAAAQGGPGPCGRWRRREGEGFHLRVPRWARPPVGGQGPAAAGGAGLPGQLRGAGAAVPWDGRVSRSAPRLASEAGETGGSPARGAPGSALPVRELPEPQPRGVRPGLPEPLPPPGPAGSGRSRPGTATGARGAAGGSSAAAGSPVSSAFFSE